MAALQIATINTARHYRLRNLRATAPSYWADFIVFDNLKKFVVRQTYKKGILVAEEGPYLAPQFSVTGCGSAHTGCTRRQPRRAVPQQWPTAGTSSPCAIAPGRPCRAAGRIFVAVCFFQTQAFREFPWSALTLSRSSHRKPTPSNPAADAHVGVRPGETGAVGAVVAGSSASTVHMMSVRPVNSQPILKRRSSSRPATRFRT